MALTGQLGTARSQPGNLVPGFASLQGEGATWAGPFSPDDQTLPGCQMGPNGVIFPPGRANQVSFPGVVMAPLPFEDIAAGQRVILPLGYAGDRSWWVFG